jgi:preprotein translocase subunit SecE
MAERAATQGSGLDTFKLAIAALLLGSGVVGFYLFADQSTLYRVLGLLAITGVAAGIALTTARGRSLWEFLHTSRTEVRKMVWPTRAETVQTTLVVFIIVIVVAVFLWLLDMLLGWFIRLIIGA